MEDNGSDIYVTDNEGPASSPAIVAGTLKRRAKARTHASRPGPPRAKRAKRTTAVGAPAASRSAPGNSAQVKHMNGDRAPFNDKSVWIDDPINHRTFMFGGIHPDDSGPGYPTSDFYCCNTISMSWKNLTNSLTFRNLENPFADEKATLPLLSLPGSALVRVTVKYEIKSFVFIFGGYDPEAKVSTSRMIVIDPDALTWWYLNIKGEGVNPRISPTVISVGNEVYIFGGFTRFGPDCGPLSSYSVLSSTPDLGTWEWRVRDRSYWYNPNESEQSASPVPTNHAFGAAISVYEGKKILLLPGRHTENDNITFTPANVFYYHITNESFQSATKDFAGSFPRNMYWYCAYEYPKPSTTSSPASHSIHSNGSASTSSPALHQPSIESRNGKRGRGRPRKNQAASQLTQLPTSTSNPASAPKPTVNGPLHSHNLFSSLTSPSIIICGWIDFGDENELAPELWHLFLSPEDRIVCLNIAKHTWDLDHDFQVFFCADGQMRLLGTETVQVEGDEQTAEQDTQRYDIYVDLLC